MSYFFAFTSHHNIQVLDTSPVKMEYLILQSGIWTSKTKILQSEALNRDKTGIVHLGCGNPRFRYRLEEKKLENSPAERELGVLADGEGPGEEDVWGAAKAPWFAQLRAEMWGGLMAACRDLTDQGNLALPATVTGWPQASTLFLALQHFYSRSMQCICIACMALNVVEEYASKVGQIKMLRAKSNCSYAYS